MHVCVCVQVCGLTRTCIDLLVERLTVSLSSSLSFLVLGSVLCAAVCSPFVWVLGAECRSLCSCHGAAFSADAYCFQCSFCFSMLSVLGLAYTHKVAVVLIAILCRLGGKGHREGRSKKLPQESSHFPETLSLFCCVILCYLEGEQISCSVKMKLYWGCGEGG